MTTLSQILADENRLRKPTRVPLTWSKGTCRGNTYPHVLVCSRALKATELHRLHEVLRTEFPPPYEGLANGRYQWDEAHLSVCFKDPDDAVLFLMHMSG